MSKKRTIIVVLLVFFIILLAVVSVYKIKFYESKDNYYFEWNEISKFRQEKNNNTTSDIQVYQDNIKKEATVSINYNFFDDNESIMGQVYIGDDQKLYITDINKNSIYRVSTIKFKDLYSKNYKYENGIYIFLISENNVLYYMELTGNKIEDAKVSEANTKLKVVNFVDLDFMSDIYGDSNTLFVLSTDNNIYDAASGIRYEPEIKILYDSLYVFTDNTMVDIYGRMLLDENGNNYKIKYIFQTYEDNEFSGKNTIIIVTEDNRLLYIEERPNYVYEFNKNVKNLEFDKNMPYIKGNLKITFEDDSYVQMAASSNEYFSLNEFKLDLD